MKIWVSSLRDVHDAHAKAKPAQIVSLLSPGSDFPDFEGYGEDRHMRVAMHDILEEVDGHDAPGERHVSEIIKFLGGWSADQPLLVHCWAGMSRSTATALIAACMHNPDTDEEEIGKSLGAASPTAYPNTRLVGIADQIMGRDGRMVRAAAKLRGDEARLAEIYRTQESVPFFIPARF